MIGISGTLGVVVELETWVGPPPKDPQSPL